MYNLDKISVAEFYELPPDEFKSYLKLESVMTVNDNMFMKRKASSFGSLEYGEVSELKLNLMDPTFDNIVDIFRIVYKVKKFDYLKANIVSYFYALKWIKKEMRLLLEKEKKLLSAEPDPELEMAGSKRLSIFGDLSTLIELGRSYSKSPEEIEKWKYSLVFSILVYDKMTGEIRKSYRELTKKKK